MNEEVGKGDRNDRQQHTRQSGHFPGRDDLIANEAEFHEKGYSAARHVNPVGRRNRKMPRRYGEATPLRTPFLTRPIS